MKTKIVLFSFLILLLVASGCVEQKVNNICPDGTVVENASDCLKETTYSEQELNIAVAKNNQKNTEFFKEYAIALNDIHLGSANITLSGINYLTAYDYVYIWDEYYYADAEDIIVAGKQNSIDAEDYLNHAKKTLQDIQDDAPNAFFSVEIQNQLRHIDALLDVSNKVYALNNNFENYLYAVNYESEERAEELYNPYFDSVPEYNDSLKELSDIENEIDAKWDRNWYITYKD